MSYTFGILFVFAVHLFYSAHCRSIRTYSNGTVSSLMIDPDFIKCSYEPINSTAIVASWNLSSSIENIDLAQDYGIYTLGIYLCDRFRTYSAHADYPASKLEEGGNITVINLSANIVYKIFFEIITAAWTEVIDDGILIRTYMEGINNNQKKCIFFL